MSKLPVKLRNLIAIGWFLELLAGSRMICPAWGQDHYCGLYAAYVVLDHYHRKVSLENLLEPKYITGFEGSTAKQIKQALEDQGIVAAHYSGLGVLDLQIASGPLILHVRGHQGIRNYHHWVVYLGEREGQAVVLDPSRGLSVMPYAQLLSLWDSVGIATASATTELWIWRATGLVQRWSMFLVLGCLTVPWVRWLDRWQPKSLRRLEWCLPVVRVVLFLGICTIMAIGLDGVDAHGLIRNPVARSAIASVHGTTKEVPEINLEQAVRLHRAAQVQGSKASIVWVDARYADDYAYGHIPGAVNLPIDATFSEEDALVEQLPVGATIVVYCQSAGCAFADAVAQRLRGRGFKNIQLFRPGFQEWKQSGAPIHRPPHSEPRQ